MTQIPAFLGAKRVCLTAELFLQYSLLQVKLARPTSPKRYVRKQLNLNLEQQSETYLKDSSRYTFHYRNSITITALSQASRARQRNRAVSAGCPISSMVKVNIMVNILYRELNSRMIIYLRQKRLIGNVPVSNRGSHEIRIIQNLCSICMVEAHMAQVQFPNSVPVIVNLNVTLNFGGR